MEDNNSPRRLSRKELIEETGLSTRALTQFEKAGHVEAEEISDGIKYYSEETSEIIRAMQACRGRCANLQESYQIALDGMALKKRGSGEENSSPLLFIDPREVNRHPRFERLLSLDEDVATSLAADMAVSGYYRSKPIVLGTWPGQEDPVLIDDHSRVRSSERAGIEKIPYVIETFNDEDGALEYIAKVQTQRRSTDDWVRYQLICELDSLMERGGDRRSEQAKSNPPDGGIETRRTTSAKRTAALVGCSERAVERARRIQKEVS